jgi:hypothetical protein
VPELENPKLEIFAIERAGGADDESAFETAGLEILMAQLPGETTGRRRSRVVRQTLKRLEYRIALLEHRIGASKSSEESLRNLRAVAELRWCQAVVANGGTEPPEWRDEDLQGERID